MCKDCNCKDVQKFYSSVDRIDDHPFQEIQLSENSVRRTFSGELDPLTLKWHWDSEDRIISSDQETDWKFQFDNELPIEFRQQIHIPAGKIHRLIKGNGDLVLEIHKSVPH